MQQSKSLDLKDPNTDTRENRFCQDSSTYRLTWDNRFCILEPTYNLILLNAFDVVAGNNDQNPDAVKSYASMLMRGLVRAGSKTESDCNGENKYLYNGWCAYCKIGFLVNNSGQCVAKK
jgi:hypothetical protein